MTKPATILLCFIIIGCSPTKKDHIKQIQRVVQEAGGESEMLKESQLLFPRCRAKTWHMPGVARNDPCFDGLGGIQALGDVFFYQPDHIRVRVHNSHSDRYFIYILDPERPPPSNFERIIGNVGFIQPPPVIYQSTPIER
jgi:hypothetical protein